MTDKTDREIMHQALKALEVATTPLAKDRQEVLRAQAALRERLAQPEQERREWQRLTEKEMKNLAGLNLVHQVETPDVSGVFDLIRAVSEKLKEKND